MIYIKRGPPPRSVALKISEIKRDPQWKEIPVTRPVEKSQQKGYGDTLRGYFDQLPKEQIRASLLKEQHYLCAYCMRRLPNTGAVKIEHWFPMKVMVLFTSMHPNGMISLKRIKLMMISTTSFA